MKSLRERIYPRLVHDADSDCLLWTGKLNHYGYGLIHLRYRGDIGVHRVIWELEVGPIPRGLVIDHVLAHGCVHKNCANVAHLEPVTPGENFMRAPSSPAAIHKAQTECVKHHPFDDANTHIRPGGGRRCRECDRLRKAGAYRADPAAALAAKARLLGREPREHGTLNAYCNYGCRCGECRAAVAAYKREQRRRERAEVLRHKAETDATSDGRITRSAS